VKVAKRYTDEIRSKHNYLATWYPSIMLSLGDIGTFNKERIFVPIGEIARHGLQINPVLSPASTDFSYHSAHDFDCHVKLATKSDLLAPHIPLDAAGIGMRFRSEGAMFFQLGDVTHERIQDQIALARKMLALANNQEWDKDWVVVTEVMHARKFVILVSESSEGSAELTAEADVSALGLSALTAEGKVFLKHSHALNTKITSTAARELTPLFRAVRIKRRWFVGPRKVAPAYSSEAEQFISAPEPDPADVLEELDDYPDADEDNLGS
jgi:hypothetical protein